MNTPPKKKRFKGINLSATESGTWSLDLHDPKYQAALGQVAAAYEHLEQAMPSVFAALMGSADTIAAGYVYRTIRSPSVRGKLMWHLLEVAPHNKDAPEWFDEILRTHDNIRVRRNDYVHGLWSHNSDDGTTYLSRSQEHGMWVFDGSKREPLENILNLVAEIHTLTRRVLVEIGPHLALLRKQQQERVLKDAERQSERDRRRAAKAPPPPPPPSEA